MVHMIADMREASIMKTLQSILSRQNKRDILTMYVGLLQVGLGLCPRLKKKRDKNDLVGEILQTVEPAHARNKRIKKPPGPTCQIVQRVRPNPTAHFHGLLLTTTKSPAAE
jgi:hypothetical protein